MDRRPRFFVLTGGKTREEAIDWVTKTGHRPIRIHLTADSSIRCYGIAEVHPPRRTWLGALRLAAPFVLDWLAIAALALLAIGIASLSDGGR